MRDLKKNQTSIYYSLYGEGEQIDEWGNPIKGYGDPKPLKIAISGNQGEASSQTFGANISYDREMITTNMNLGIDEYTHIWIDREPTDDYNYVVKAVSKTLNQVKYAIKKVEVNENH